MCNLLKMFFKLFYIGESAEKNERARTQRKTVRVYNERDETVYITKPSTWMINEEKTQVYLKQKRTEICNLFQLLSPW